MKPICLTHLGTNQFIRAAYLPKTWSHRMSAIDGKTGKLKKSEDQITYDVAGPLCFQVSREIALLFFPLNKRNIKYK